jgi:site-specific recombinase XerD
MILNEERQFASPGGKYGGWHPGSVKRILDTALDPKQQTRKRTRRRGVFGDGYLDVTQAAKLFTDCKYVLEAKESTLRQRRAARLVTAFLLTGIRRFEICKLRIMDMPSSHGKREIIVRGKNRTLAPVRITPYAVTFFNGVCAGRRHGYVFPSENDKAHDPGQINKIVKGFGRSVNLPTLRPHTLRHTYASILLWAGCNLPFVRDQLRHASISTTDIYSHVLLDLYHNEMPAEVALLLGAMNPLHPANAQLP